MSQDKPPLRPTPKPRKISGPKPPRPQAVETSSSAQSGAAEPEDAKRKNAAVGESRPRINLLLWRADPSVRYQPLVTALASFLIVVMVLALVALGSNIGDARNQIRAEITIQVPPGDGGFDASISEAAGAAGNRLLAQVESVLDSQAGIASYRLLNVQEIRDLLEPWMGQGVELAGLPVPYVFAVQRQVEGDPLAAGLDLVSLKGALDAIEPNIVVDDHASTLEGLDGLEQTFQVLGLVVFFVMLLLLAVLNAIAANVAIRTQNQVLEVLFLSGANDGFLVRQFMWFALDFGVRGLLVGTVLGGAAYLGGLWALGLSAHMGPWLGFSMIQILAMLLVWLAVLGISVLATRQVIARRLKEIY